MNFGDDLNAWLWPQLLPNTFNQSSDILLVGFGTVLNTKIPYADKVLVFSSGVGYGPCPKVTKKWKIYCVRGPLTAQALGISSDFVATDGAVLATKVFKWNGQKKYPVSFMPHFTQAYHGRESWKSVCEQLDIHFIDPSDATQEILTDITHTELLITESMHGAVVADAFRIPWVAIKTHEDISTFKWYDWCASLGLNYDPLDVLPLWDVPVAASKWQHLRGTIKRSFVYQQMAYIMKKAKPVLSRRENLLDKINHLDESLHQLKTDLIDFTSLKSSQKAPIVTF